MKYTIAASLMFVVFVSFSAFAHTANAYTGGDRVQTTAKLTVRSAPSGRRLGAQNLGAQGTIVGNSVFSKGYTWLNINYDTGLDGWSVQDYLNDLTAPAPAPVPAPAPTPAPTPVSVSSTTVTVTDTASLNAAVKNAKAGDTILLAPGTYSSPTISNLTFSTPITLTSADPSHMAVLTNFDMRAVDGLTFRYIEFLVVSPAYVGYNVYSSQHLTFDQVYVHGSLDNDSSNDAEGIRFFDSNNITVTNSIFQQLNKGAQFANVNTLTVTGNAVHHVDASGFVFSQVSYVKVRGNIIHDINPTGGLHPDALQFTTANTTVQSHDIEVSGNLIYKGTGGAYTQGIFMRDEIGNLPFLNVTIADNLIIGTGWSAIRPTHNTGLTITGNKLVSFLGDEDTRATIEFSDQVNVTNNQAISIGYGSVTNLTQSGNATTTAVTDAGTSAIQSWLPTHAAVQAVYNNPLSLAPRTTPNNTALALLRSLLTQTQALLANLNTLNQLAGAGAAR